MVISLAFVLKSHQSFAITQFMIAEDKVVVTPGSDGNGNGDCDDGGDNDRVNDDDRCNAMW